MRSERLRDVIQEQGKVKDGEGREEGTAGEVCSSAQETTEKRKGEKTKHCAMLWPRVGLKRKQGQIKKASSMRHDGRLRRAMGLTNLRERGEHEHTFSLERPL